jgi:integrase
MMARKAVLPICRHLAPDLAAAVQFMFITGWRSRSEVLPLRWQQVDLAGGFVRLEPGPTKNTEGRAFPVIPELRTLLEGASVGYPPDPAVEAHLLFSHGIFGPRASGACTPARRNRIGRNILGLRPVHERRSLAARARRPSCGFSLRDLRGGVIMDTTRRNLLKLVGVGLTVLPRVSWADNDNRAGVPPFDFADAFYRQNGINPANILERVNGMCP